MNFGTKEKLDDEKGRDHLLRNNKLNQLAGLNLPHPNPLPEGEGTKKRQRNNHEFR